MNGLSFIAVGLESEPALPVRPVLPDPVDSTEYSSAEYRPAIAWRPIQLLPDNLVDSLVESV